MTIRILLADDHKIVREGLRSLLDGQRDMQVVAEAEDGRTAVTLTRKLAPHVVVMDIGMPDLNGIEATRQICAVKGPVKVIALSMHSDSRFVLRMFEAGASGYVLKDAAFEELARAVREVFADRTYVSPAVADIVVDEYVRRHGGSGAAAASPLTPREREVLQLLAEGWSTKGIAAHLKVSVKTVETHRQHIMEKLDIHSVAELTKYAVREGLTSLNA
jgi:two-component system response regulator NreC